MSDPQNRAALLFLEPYSLFFFLLLLALTPLSHSATLTGFIGLNKACVGKILIKLTLDWKFLCGHVFCRGTFIRQMSYSAKIMQQ